MFNIGIIIIIIIKNNEYMLVNVITSINLMLKLYKALG